MVTLGPVAKIYARDLAREAACYALLRLILAASDGVLGSAASPTSRPELIQLCSCSCYCRPLYVLYGTSLKDK